jgi:hypothetical protein
MLKSGGAFLGQSESPVMDLYRRICKEVPRILTIYDIDMDTAEVNVTPSKLLRQQFMHSEAKSTNRITPEVAMHAVPFELLTSCL